MTGIAAPLSRFFESEHNLAGAMVQQQQPSLSSSSSKKNSRAMDSRPFGLGSALYAELSRVRTATKKRALEVNHTMADGNRATDDRDMVAKQSVYPSSPSSEPMKRNAGNVATNERSVFCLIGNQGLYRIFFVAFFLFVF